MTPTVSTLACMEAHQELTERFREVSGRIFSGEGQHSGNSISSLEAAVERVEARQEKSR